MGTKMDFGSRHLSKHFTEINETLSECLDCLDDIAGGNTDATPNQAGGESVQSLILSALMAKMNMAEEHGSTQRQERTVQENQSSENEEESESD